MLQFSQPSALMWRVVSCYDVVMISHATKLYVMRLHVSHNDLADLWDNGDKEDHVSPLTTLMLTLCVPC